MRSPPPGATAITPGSTPIGSCATAAAVPSAPPAAPPDRRDSQGRSHAMIVSTAPFIAGHKVVETKGQTFGLVVRSRGLAGNVVAGLRSLVGGEIHEYTQL